MIIIYRSPTANFVAVAEQLKAEGLIIQKDYKFENEQCFRSAHITKGEIYLSATGAKADNIALHYQSYPDVQVHRI